MNFQIHRYNALIDFHLALNRLEAEKLRYSKYVEASESASQHSRNHQLEEKINEVKMETYASAQRRERLRIQLLQENNAKYV